jgi:hypothetical protein
MKKTLLLLILLITSIAAHATDVLSRRIDIAFADITLKSALDKVAQRGQFECSYNPVIIETQRSVSINANDLTVREVLYKLLGDKYQFKVNGNYVIIVKAPKTRKEVSGYLRDPVSGERVANATVYDKRTLRATTTDSSGYYELKTKRSADIVVTRLGYRDTTLQVTSQSPSFQQITIAPIPMQSNEIPQRKFYIWKINENTPSGLEALFRAKIDEWHLFNVPDTLHRRFQISLLPYAGTNHTLSGKVENDFSINIIAGHSAGVRFFEAGGIGNFTRRRVSGLQLAGVFNFVQGSCKGVQGAGLFNVVEDTLGGVQLAGAVNYATHSNRGSIQAAGLFNYSTTNEPGNIQVSGFANLNLFGPSIIQAASTINAAYAISGVQLAGTFNYAQKVEGAQLSGCLNATNELRGVQIGLINHAKKARGVQIGVFNNSKDFKGLQIGLINRSGRRVLPIFNW